MKYYKGFDKNLQCRGFQYEIGKEYETDTAVLCESGFHACEYPLDVFGYYPPTDSRYCEVELDDVIDEHEPGTTRVCAKKIKIVAELSIADLVELSVEYIGRSEYSVTAHTDGNRKAASANVDQGVSSATADHSAASASGYYVIAGVSGYQSAAKTTGNYSAAVATEYGSAAVATLNYSVACTTNNMSAAVATARESAAVSVGWHSAASVTGKSSVAIALSGGSVVKGALGCAIACVERGKWDEAEEASPIKAICSAIVDGEKIKADTWYTVKGGEFVEVGDAID